MKINQIITIICFLSFSFSQDKGIEFYQNQEYEKAKDFYDNILIKKGENEEAHFGHGASSYQQGDLELAKKSFQESLKSTDNDLRSKAFYNLGNTFYKNKKNEEAISFYRKALELNPSDKEARFNYEYLKYQKKPPEEDNKEEQKEEEQKEEEQKEEEQKEQEQKEQEQKEQEQKEQDLKQAESILNALKQDEKIMQKKQISRSKSRKLAKDW